ncbi:hypothetical protein FOZ60_005045 [Perkinsus olseni]|uniref:EF-hand domain-containing protein n=1 Tax=Perkinsus olseni TaxID=32597 RepID=A0A7J6NSM5_PEROL|nr:hypothetical protein FOZ60_005045 [Perkinsus olseni]
MFGQASRPSEENARLRETFHRIAAEWRKKNEGPSPISLSKATRLAKDEVAYCKRLYAEVDLDAKGKLGRGELTIALRKMGLDRRVPEFAEAEDGPEWFRKFCQRVGPGILWQVHYLDAAFDTYSCRTADGEEFVSPENFEKLYEALANHWSKHMPIDREKASRKSMNAVRNAAYAAKVADETAKQFSLLNLDESSMLRIFHLYDSDKSGFLEASEIRQIAQEMKIPDYGRDHYRGFIRRNARHVDDNGDGQIEFGEFKSLLQSLVTCKVLYCLEPSDGWRHDMSDMSPLPHEASDVYYRVGCLSRRTAREDAESKTRINEGILRAQSPTVGWLVRWANPGGRKVRRTLKAAIDRLAVFRVATAARSPLVGRPVATKPTGMLTAALQAGTRRYHSKEPAAEKPHELIVFPTEVHRSGESGFIIHTTDGAIVIASNEGILEDGRAPPKAKLKVTGWPLSDGVWLVNKTEHSATS